MKILITTALFMRPKTAAKAPLSLYTTTIFDYADIVD